MDEIWERAVETALDGQTDLTSVRTLTLDGAVKCVHGRLPPPSRFEKFRNLQHLSLANIGLSSLEHFPRLQNLQKLILSDNRIAGGLELLVEAGLELLRDLDLSNNRIQDINGLKPLRELKLVSLDLYECPVTRVKDYRSRVFGLIKSLKYLDKMDAEENERPESEDEEEDKDDEENDLGSGDGEDRLYRMNNGHGAGGDVDVDVDEDEESDADEEETEMSPELCGLSQATLHHYSNGFGMVATGNREEDEEEGEDEEDDSVEEIDELEGEDEDVIEVHEIEDSDDEEDWVEDDDDVDVEDYDNEDEEEVDNDEGFFGEPKITGRLTSTEGEIDGHEQGEEDGKDDDNRETGEEEQRVEEEGEFEDEEDAEEDNDYAGYLLQPVGQAEEDTRGSDIDPGNEDDSEMEEDVEDEDDEVQVQPPSSSHKRKRDEDDSEEEDDIVEYAKSWKHH